MYWYSSWCMAVVFFFFKQKTAYEMRISDWSSDVCSSDLKAGISQTAYFNWKKKYAGLTPSEMRHLRELEQENGRLKKIVADFLLDKEMLQDVIKRKL